MRLLKRDGTAYTVEVSEAELTLLDNALNEVCDGIDVPEFQTRLGATDAAAQSALKRIDSLLPTA